jgi:UPF0042 nucleotide-binding protein
MVIITGMSGAGRSTAGHALEDLGWFVVDNLPPGLLPPLMELAGRSQGTVPRIAAVVDVRSRTFFTDLRAALDAVAAGGTRPRILYLEASDEALVRRYESVRRQHPMQGEGRVTDGIEAERALLEDLRGQADLVIDTTALNVHELRSAVEAAILDPVDPTLRVTLVSFGYKYGLPVDCDLVLDCRFLPNPHWLPELRPRTGLDPAVSEYVLGQPGAQDVVERYVRLVGDIAPGYLREGKRFVTIGVGCTGGKHRSVAVSEEIGLRLRELGMSARVVHRDLGRE